MDDLDSPSWHQNNRPRDVCVLGSGASGESAAVFLKDKFYDVLVLEREDHIGGHCDTEYFTPPVAGQPNYIDLGAQIYTDTAYSNASGFGTWTLSSRAFAQRFVPAASLLPNNLPDSIQSGIYLADFARSTFLGPAFPQPPPTADFVAAFGRLFALIASYPWLETADFPDPIPAPLLQPFDQFVAANNFSVLGSLFYGEQFIGGMGNWANLTTLYALQNMRRGVLMLRTDPNAAFRFDGGCLSLYRSITNYLGAENVLTNANVVSVDRPSGNSNRPTRLLVRFNNSASYRLIKCRNLIVSFPQVLSNLGFMDLTAEERALFGEVRVRNYYDIRVNISGPITEQTDAKPWWTLGNFDISPTSGGLAPYPTLMALKRDLNYGPGAGYAFDDGNLTEQQMETVIRQLIANINFPGVLNISLVSSDRHQFQAHFTAASLAQSPTPYTRFDALQGKKHTYWTGALRSYAESANIWHKTYNLINQYF